MWPKALFICLFIPPPHFSPQFGHMPIPTQLSLYCHMPTTKWGGWTHGNTLPPRQPDVHDWLVPMWLPLREHAILFCCVTRHPGQYFCIGVWTEWTWHVCNVPIQISNKTEHNQNDCKSVHHSNLVYRYRGMVAQRVESPPYTWFNPVYLVQFWARFTGVIEYCGVSVHVICISLWVSTGFLPKNM